jgi:hypothetical protein
MSPDDQRVWRRFLLLHPSKFEAFRYDVRVGSGQFAWDGPEANPPAEWLAIAAKRIDVVAQRHGTTCIIEVKPRASMSAIGQVLSYRDLYAAKEKPSTPLECWVVCEYRDEDLIPTYLRHGIGVVAVGV